MKKAKTLTDEFDYPLRGPGMMWERFRAVLESQGATVVVNAEATGIKHDNGRAVSVKYRVGDREEEVPASHVVSSMPITKLLTLLDPPPNADLLQAAERLRYRAFVTVGLVVEKKDLFPDQWIYIHSPNVRVGRIQNFKNWSAAMVPDRERTSVGMEYFCNEGDELWNLSDTDLRALASKELSELGFCTPRDVADSFVIRQGMAYPVYDEGYADALKTIRRGLEKFDNVHTIGRNGMHRYNNMDHSMLTGILAARNVMGATHSLWEVNEEESYLEEDQAESAESFLSENFFGGVFARIDKLAFATAFGSVSALIAFLATIWPVIYAGDQSLNLGLGLLAQYFVGYRVSVTGALIASAYTFFWGFLFGWLFAYVRNLGVAIFIYRIRRKAEKLAIQDFLDGY